MDDFQNIVMAAQELKNETKEYGIRLKVNSDGTITFYHGTSKENAGKIQEIGFLKYTYFSHSLNKTGYGDESPKYYAKIKHKKGVVIKANIDCRYIDFASGTGEFILNSDYKATVCSIV